VFCTIIDLLQCRPHNWVRYELFHKGGKSLLAHKLAVRALNILVHPGGPDYVVAHRWCVGVLFNIPVIFRVSIHLNHAALLV
jgi:hypothetical protein